MEILGIDSADVAGDTTIAVDQITAVVVADTGTGAVGTAVDMVAGVAAEIGVGAGVEIVETITGVVHFAP
jgi:hypothetical protein